MTVVGIDVSKGKSMVAAMKPGGELVAAPDEVSIQILNCRALRWMFFAWSQIPAS